MPIVTLQDGIQYPAEADETILDAAARAGVNIGYSCRTGRCSSCRCKVLDGTTRALRPELGLEEHEVREGWILSCVRTAISDVALLAEELIPFALPLKRITPCRIDRLVLLAPDVLEVRLRLPPNAPFMFLPGQYVDVIGPGGVRRSYSLASGGTPTMLTLHVRQVSGGVMSTHWFAQAKPGDLLRLAGPLGTFVLRGIEGRRVVFLATGTGIAPVTAMLEALTVAGVSKPADVTVIWGGRQASDFYLDVSAISGDHAFWPVLSRPDENWGGRFGYVQDALIASGRGLDDTVVFACGSDNMIRSARKALITAGLDPRNFHSDAFVASATS